MYLQKYILHNKKTGPDTRGRGFDVIYRTYQYHKSIWYSFPLTENQYQEGARIGFPFLISYVLWGLHQTTISNIESKAMILWEREILLLFTVSFGFKWKKHFWCTKQRLNYPINLKLRRNFCGSLWFYLGHFPDKV